MAMTIALPTRLAALKGRLAHWAGVLAEYALAQGIGQVAGMLSGLIYVQTLPVDQYALYALCLTSMAMISLGSDMGLASSLNYFWRQSRTTNRPFAPMLIGVRQLRTVLYGGSLAIGAGVLLSSMKLHGVPPWGIVICFVLIAATALSNILASIDIQLMRLEGRQRQSYYCETTGSIARLIGAVGFLVIGVATAWLALAGGLVAALAALAMVLALRTPPPPASPPSGADWGEIRRYMLPLVPAFLVYMAQEPIVLWFTAVRAGPTIVAEVFALGRVGAIFALIGTFIYVVLTPRLAAISDPRRFLNAALAALAALVLVLTVGLAIAAVAPWLPLLLIGSKYAHLTTELLVLMAASSVTIITGFFVLVNRARGWVRLEGYISIVQLVAIVGLSAVWPFSGALNVLWLTFLLATINLVCSMLTFVVGNLKPWLVALEPAQSAIKITKDRCI